MGNIVLICMKIFQCVNLKKKRIFSIKINKNPQSELFTDGCICAPQKKRQKKEKYGCIYLPMVYIHTFVVPALLHGVKPLCAVLSTIGRGCPYDATLTFSPSLLFHRTLVGFIHEWNQVLGSSIPSSFFSNNKMQQKRNT